MSAVNTKGLLNFHYPGQERRLLCVSSGLMLQALYNLTTNYFPDSTKLLVSLQERLCICCYKGTDFLNITYFNSKPNFLKKSVINTYQL